MLWPYRFLKPGVFMEEMLDKESVRIEMDLFRFNAIFVASRMTAISAVNYIKFSLHCLHLTGTGSHFISIK